ncbi:Mu transposase C-terminal domain-containing protein [Streptomyces sp. NPDC059452]|uniref:Mu transposase C-terminal domain-containing protein n=1 Tax=Streptomyces sp. NPDC059452 TaxID=3346835 RepID=UPI0036B53544
MGGHAVTVFPGSQLAFCGEVVEVVEFSHRGVTIRNVRTGEFSTVSVGRLAADAQMRNEGLPGPGDSAGLLLASLSRQQRDALSERAGHIREVLTGYRAGFAEGALPGEPREEFTGDRSLPQRVASKATELRVAVRSVERWTAAYQGGGEAALVDSRLLKRRGSRVDPRWDEAVRAVLAEYVTASTPTRSAVLKRVEAWLEEVHGSQTVPLPSQATAYRRLAVLSKGTNAVSGSAKARRSIAERPQGTYGRLRATRPGEYVVLDTQDLDVFAMEPVTCRWVRAQLTVAQDLFSRCIVGLRVTAVSTKAVDVAGVLFEAVAPPGNDTSTALGPYHGVPEQVVLTEEEPVPGRGLCPPETLVIDHGKAFLSAHVISVCARLGISIQPAQPKKPTDKPTVERFFRTLREGLIQHLPAYKGPDLHSRGEKVEDQAFFYIHELEDVIRDWVASTYHRSQHDGLVIPQWPGVELSPLEMLEAGLARAGRLRLLPSAGLVFDFLQLKARTIQHYGVEVDGMRYNGPALDGYRGEPSPFGGLLAGRWPLRVNPDDVRFVYFQDPADDSWHALEWEHAAALHTPFSAEAAAHARRLSMRRGRHVDSAEALDALLARWGQGMVTDRRERRMALRLSTERAALPLPRVPEEEVLAPARLHLVAEPVIEGDGDDDEEIFDAPDGDDFYADAFEVLE